MANAALSIVPDSLGDLIPLFTAALALPLGFFMSNAGGAPMRGRRPVGRRPPVAE